MSVCGKLRLRLRLVIGIGLRHGLALGLGFDTCSVAYKVKLLLFHSLPQCRNVASPPSHPARISRLRLRVKALPASWHLMSVA